MNQGALPPQSRYGAQQAIDKLAFKHTLLQVIISHYTAVTQDQNLMILNQLTTIKRK